MGYVQASHVMRARVEDVAELVSHPEQLPVWFHLVARCTAADALTREGERFQYDLRMLGRVFPGQGRVTRWVPGEALELAAEDALGTWEWSLALARRGARSRVTLSVGYSGLDALVHRGMSPTTVQNLMYTTVDHSLATLSTLMEDPAYLLAASRGRRLAPEALAGAGAGARAAAQPAARAAALGG